jgi:1-acyl-sn-glycerol-3-phosphate acyltransferase
MWAIVRSLWAWLAIGILCLVWVPWLYLVRIFDRDPVRYRTGRWFRRLGVVQTKVNPAWKIKVEGAEKVSNPRNPYAVVGNHQSMADIPLFSLLPWEMKWIGKASLWKLPYGGRMFKLAGDIPVDRSDPNARTVALEKAVEYLKQKVSVMFFAEGTRSRDGKLLPFKDGAFLAAIRTQVPVLPVIVEGSHDCLPRKSIIFRDCPAIRLKVFDPVPTEGMTEDDVPRLRDQVRALFVNQLMQWRNATVEQVDSLAEEFVLPESKEAAGIGEPEPARS